MKLENLQTLPPQYDLQLLSILHDNQNMICRTKEGNIASL